MMWPIIALAIGLVIGFIIGWLVRDYLSSGKRLLRPDEFGMGVPGDWYQRLQRRPAD